MTKPRTENGVIVRCVQDAPAELSGLYLQPFYIHLNTDLLRPGDRVVPTTSQDYQRTLVVQSKPEAAGKGYLYKVCHMFEDKNAYYHPQLIAKDAEFEYIGNQLPDLKYYDTWILDYVKFN